MEIRLPQELRKKGSSAEGSVYYLNFKPEIADQWEEIAAKYTEETGVQ